MEELDNIRQAPQQERSRASMDFILDAAAQVLERDGEAGFNTSAVAERAGVSIGTLYRYFPDKKAILKAMGMRETLAFRKVVAQAMAGPMEGIARDRAMIRAFVHAFDGQAKARRIAMMAMLAQADHRALAEGFGPVETSFVDAKGEPLSPVAGFVLSRAVQGAMRAAVLEGADFLASQEFEDELVKLSRAYLGYAPKA
jgi:AcrR family transcriptional regulator